MARRGIWVVVLAALFGTPAYAQICNDFVGGPVVGPGQHLGNESASLNCAGFSCHPAEQISQVITSPGCDPEVATCTVRATITMRLLGTSRNRQISPLKWTTGDWIDRDGSTLIGSCGKGTADILQDLFEAWVEIGGFSCIDGSPPPPLAGTYTLEMTTCNLVAGCTETVPFAVNLTVPGHRGGSVRPRSTSAFRLRRRRGLPVLPWRRKWLGRRTGRSGCARQGQRRRGHGCRE